MKSFRSRRALSPIFATLILIAIAVIAGIVVYMFTSGTIAGLTGGGGAGQEKVAIQSVSYDSTGPSVTALAQPTGGPIATINGMIIKDATGNVVDQDLGISQTLVADTLSEVTGTLTAALPAGTYTCTLTSEAGGSFVSSSFTVA
jgi:flagellin-like protein